MKSIRLTLHVTILLAVALLVGSAPALAATSQTFNLAGIEISAGTTTIGVSTYTTTGIRFVGIANGDARTKWTVSLNVQGQLDQTGAPEVCVSPVQVTGGTLELVTPGGRVSGQITGVGLAWRPDGPGAGSVCPGPVPGSLTLNVTSATGLYRFVNSATLANAFLDHNFFPPRVAADLTLSSP